MNTDTREALAALPPPPKQAGFLEQIEACRRDVASWPEWMRATADAPKWMEGWDDL